MEESGEGSSPVEAVGTSDVSDSTADFLRKGSGRELNREALRKMIDRIELNLSLGGLLQVESPSDTGRENLPSLERLRKAKDNLCLSSAPLLPSVTEGPSSFWRKLLNVPARLFLQEQIRFNRELRVFIEELEGFVFATNDHLIELHERVSELEGVVGTSIDKPDHAGNTQPVFESRFRDLENRLGKIEDTIS